MKAVIPDLTKKLEAIIAQNLNINPSEIDKEMTPDSIDGWDSLAQLSLISSIEEEFNLVFEIEEIFQIIKIGDIYDILSEKGCIDLLV